MKFQLWKNMFGALLPGMAYFSQRGLLVIAAGLLLALGSCGLVDNYVDCNRICNRYRDCVDANYNASSCISRCYDQSRSNPDYNRKANECSACLEDRACQQSVPCTLPCAGIAP